MVLRVLLAQSGTDDVLFLNDVLTELDGSRCWSDWVRLEASHAATWAETAAILAAEPVDILLLDPDLPDSQDSETFRLVQAAAPHVPVILLVEPSATSLAEHMVRNGAQDFLLKKEVDCVPLARAIRNALERHRLLAAARSTSMTDQLTGLLTRSAFVTMADRDRLIAERLSRKLLLAVAEAPDLCRGHQQRDLALVETADGLRRLGGPATLVARLGHSQFGLAAIDAEAEPIDEIQMRLHAAEIDSRITFGAAVFDPRHPVSLDVLLEEAARSLHLRAGSTASVGI